MQLVTKASIQNEDIILESFNDLLSSCKHFSDASLENIKKAFHFANDAHNNMYRKSGVPYILHPIAVAKIVVEEIGLRDISIISALLHDVIEDTTYTYEDVHNLFGEKIANFVDSLTKIADVFDQAKSLQAENLKKMLFTLSDDLRVMLVKLADRLHNMRTLSSMPPRKQIKIADETLYIFAPLAHRMGLYNIKMELENLSLKNKNAAVYDKIAKNIKYYEGKSQSIIEKFIEPIATKLTKENFEYTFISRPKSIYSIWSKSQTKGISVEEIYDQLATRIIFKSKQNISEQFQCWEIYSIISSIYQVHPHRIRDWISSPKANGYEALHVTVMGPTGQWIEVQIRSERMHEIAEKGLAAHWKYKENEQFGTKIDKWLQDVSEHLKNSNEDGLEFLDEFKLNLFIYEIQVFTPKGDIHTLPQGATVLDFAFKIHTDLGLNCIGAKVNFKLVAPNHILQSGDQIEILTSKNQKPKLEWLDYVVTARAKSKLKSIFKTERRKAIYKGKKIFNEIFFDLKIKKSTFYNKKLLAQFNVQNLEELHHSIGRNLIEKDEIRNTIKENKKSFMKIWRLRFIRYKKSDNSRYFKDVNNKIKLDEKFVDYKVAPCCMPIPGDAITSFHDPTENTIVVHDQKCSTGIKLSNTQGNRIVETEWKPFNIKSFPATIELLGIDSKGIVNKITQIISKDYNINMRAISFESKDGIFNGKITLNISHVNNLNILINKLLKIKGLTKITRI